MDKHSEANAQHCKYNHLDIVTNDKASVIINDGSTILLSWLYFHLVSLLILLQILSASCSFIDILSLFMFLVICYFFLPVVDYK